MDAISHFRTIEELVKMLDRNKYRIIVPNLIKKHRFGTIISHIETFE